MTRAADFTTAVILTARHCNRFDCDKCRARYRWTRRKAWRSRRSPNRSARNRKR